MKAWQDFLDSLSTRGGGIVITFALWVLLTPVVLYVVIKGLNFTSLLLVTNAWSGATTALFAVMGNNASKQQMVDRASTAAPPQQIDVQKVETVNVGEAAKTIPGAQ